MFSMMFDDGRVCLILGLMSRLQLFDEAVFCRRFGFCERKVPYPVSGLLPVHEWPLFLSPKR
jgi:hypothetical protein